MTGARAAKNILGRCLLNRHFSFSLRPVASTLGPASSLIFLYKEWGWISASRQRKTETARCASQTKNQRSTSPVAPTLSLKLYRSLEFSRPLKIFNKMEFSSFRNKIFKTITNMYFRFKLVHGFLRIDFWIS